MLDLKLFFKPTFLGINLVYSFFCSYRITHVKLLLEELNINYLCASNQCFEQNCTSNQCFEQNCDSNQCFERNCTSNQCFERNCTSNQCFEPVLRTKLCFELVLRTKLYFEPVFRTSALNETVLRTSTSNRWFEKNCSFMTFRQFLSNLILVNLYLYFVKHYLKCLISDNILRCLSPVYLQVTVISE